ncbi:TonB-dependent receptor [Parasphingorhabdus sp.]|uniref:TonB-dependent receptor plug domain-containing protein n=1 Tax=Parasphingorhabdus sp. TaxID=2709688 RepID=UPI0030A9D004|nr:TonB-dependent receptor [Sphingomonadales bacterium]
MYKYRILATFLASSAYCCTPPASAADDREIIVTATGIEQDIDDTGAAISILSEADIRDQQSITLSAILQELPGVNVTQSGGLGSQSSVRIRGAENDQTLVLINGIRVNDPSTPDGSFDFGNLLAGNIERVEVLRGASGVTWGSQAVGGVVNITTKRPTEDLILFAQGEYGAHETVRLVSNASGKLGPIGLSIGGGYARTDGISAFSAGTEPDGYRQYSASGQLQVDMTDNVWLEASGYYADSRVDNDSVFPPYSSDDSQFSLAKEIYGNASIHAQALDGRFQNRFGFSIADINRDIISPYFTSLPRGRTERFEYRGDFALIEQLRFVFGAEKEDSRYENSGERDSTGIDSFFFQTVFKPADGLTLTGGIRHDEHEDFGGNTSLAGNLVYRLSEDGPTIRASYAEGFRAPSLIDLDDRPFGYGTPDLLPETAKSYEIGVHQSLIGQAVRMSVTLFQRDTDNQISFAACPVAPDPAPEVCTSGTRPYGTTLNIERNRTRGVEAVLSIAPVERLRIDANYTWLDTENRSSGANFGNELARRPASSLYLNATYQTSFGLSLGADLQIVGDSFDDLANSRRLERYALAGVRASMPVTDGIEIFGRIDNLLDVNYQTATDFGSPGRSAYMGARARF